MITGLKYEIIKKIIIKILLLIFVLALIIIWHKNVYGEKDGSMLKEEFEKEYNLKIDPDDFRMKRHFEFLRELEATKGYVVWRKNDPWISAYWESNAVIHRNEHDNFANFIEALGVDWYIKGKLAKDKSKGNDLSKIYEVIK